MYKIKLQYWEILHKTHLIYSLNIFLHFEAVFLVFPGLIFHLDLEDYTSNQI